MSKSKSVSHLLSSKKKKKKDWVFLHLGARCCDKEEMPLRLPPFFVWEVPSVGVASSSDSLSPADTALDDDVILAPLMMDSSTLVGFSCKNEAT